MSRILELQKMTSINSLPDRDLDDSTSSNNGCACSTESAAVCFMGDEFIAV
ncbi:hypothetical protein [Marilutibacter maris]|uniref:hypothetical protein n=1 Tax=Marilutibacter maris TaxID=1605891 RepID=UPI00167DC772|nr:hypothetical protein [Lysobacter maris]